MASRRHASSDRRAEDRHLCAQLVGVKWTDCDQRAKDCLAVLEDISTSGACLRNEQPIPVNTRIRIAYGGGHLPGVVRYCSFREAGFFLGIQFDPDTRWSDERFRPESLTEVRDLYYQSIRRNQPRAGVRTASRPSL